MLSKNYVQEKYNFAAVIATEKTLDERFVCDQKKTDNIHTHKKTEMKMDDGNRIMKKR